MSNYITTGSTFGAQMTSVSGGGILSTLTSIGAKIGATASKILEDAKGQPAAKPPAGSNYVAPATPLQTASASTGVPKWALIGGAALAGLIIYKVVK